MFILKTKGKRLPCAIKRDYPDTANPHYFVIGNPDKTFYLCREFNPNENPKDYLNTAVIKETGKNQKIRCRIICEAETEREIDTVVSLYLKTIDTIQAAKNEL